MVHFTLAALLGAMTGALIARILRRALRVRGYVRLLWAIPAMAVYGVSLAACLWLTRYEIGGGLSHGRLGMARRKHCHDVELLAKASLAHELVSRSRVQIL